MEPETCPIWETDCKLASRDWEFWLDVDSPRAGGKYSVIRAVAASISNLTPRQKAILTSWLIDQRRAGIENPKVTADTIEEIRSRSPISFSSKIDRALNFIARRIQKLGDEIVLFQGQQMTDLGNSMMAHTEIQDRRELHAFFRLLEQMELIVTGDEINSLRFQPTFRAWERIEQLQSSATDSTQAFVAMWFHNSTQDAYEKGILPAIKDAGYSAVRIDQKHHVNKVDDEIIADIRRSRFLVADFTCELEKPRGGVYFEAGFALGLPIPVIWTCKDASMKDLHFDTRQYNHIVWQEPADLYLQLKARIGAILGDGSLIKQA